MTTEELRTLKNELQQLDVELKSFKKEILTTRTAELVQIVHGFARKPRRRLSGVSKLVDE